MISQDDIDAFTEDSIPEDVRDDLVRALRGVNTALHYMAETCWFESEELDEIQSELRRIDLRIRSVTNGR
jgi:hypothetical protein